jgi:hypothetical protein
MPIFEVSPQKVLKKIRKLAAEGSIGKVPQIIREEREKLLEDPAVAVELVAFLLDIAHPDMAAEISEEVMRRHRTVANQVRSMIVARLPEFSRSTELLRAAWRSLMDKSDFRGALDLLSMGDKIAESRFMDESEERMKSALRFDGSIHPDADQSALITWSLCLYRKDRADDAVEFLWKVCRSLEFPQRGISNLAFWIGDRTKALDTAQWISLMGIAAISNQMERAIQYASLLLESRLSPDSAVDAAAVIEKWMVPVDGSGRSSAILAKMFTVAGRIEAATKVLEDIFPRALDREKLAEAISELVAHPESGAAPLLLSAKLALEKGDVFGAEAALKKAFTGGGADSARLMEVSRSLIAETGDTTGDIARRLATHLVENGDIRDAVASLFPIISSDPEWVFNQVHKLVARDRTSASVLALLSAVLLETGKKQQALVALEHLSSRRDRRSCNDAADVLDVLEEQVAAFPELREARALFRFRSDRRDDAAADWFRLLLAGVNPSEEGRNLLTGSELRIGTVADLTGTGFTPRAPFQAFVAALICLREHEPELADGYLLMALDDQSLHQRIADRLSELPVDILTRIDLSIVLPAVARGGAAASVASMLGKLQQTRDWMLSLVTELHWGEPREEALFRLKYLLDRGRVFVAGSSFRDGSTDDPAVVAIAHACRAVADGKIQEALELLEKPVSRSWTSSMARSVLSGLLSHIPAEEPRLRILIARSYETDRNFPACAGALDPMLHVPEVWKALEEMVAAHPGEQALVSSLTTAAAKAGDFERFRRFSTVLLDLDPSSAAGLVEMSLSLGRRENLGMAFLHAARISRKHGPGGDFDGMITSALHLDPGLAIGGLKLEFGSLSPSTEALCSLASGDAASFGRIGRENPELSLQLTPLLITAPLISWRPADDSEALTALAEHMLSNGMEGAATDLLARLSSEAPQPWSAMACRRLLREVTAGRAERALFWRSARDIPTINEAIGTLLPGGHTALEPGEAPGLASAILRSDKNLAELLELSDDPVLFPPDNRNLAAELAAACSARLPLGEGVSPLTPSQSERLVEALIAGGRMSQAAELCRSLGSDVLLARLRDDLRTSRTAQSGTVACRAEALLLGGDPAGALRLLDSPGDVPAGTLDLAARAQWNLGLRRLAIGSWLREHSASGDLKPLLRLLWALEEAGAPLDRTALVRYLAQKYPGAAGLAVAQARRKAPGSGYELISGLHSGWIQKKVKNG